MIGLARRRIRFIHFDRIGKISSNKMDFTESIASFLSNLPLKKMSGQEKFLAVVIYLCAGETNKEVAVAEVVKKLSKGVLKIKYNPSVYSRAAGQSGLRPIDGKKGVFTVTSKGVKHIENLSSPQGASAVMRRVMRSRTGSVSQGCGT